MLEVLVRKTETIKRELGSLSKVIDDVERRMRGGIRHRDADRLSDDTVHLHLEQRVAQRLLARFRAQGFVYHDRSRACLAQANDSIPRVILLGRLCLYGRRAERLHEEIVPLAARWIEPGRRSGPLRAYAREAETRTLDLLDQSLTGRLDWTPHDVIRARLLAAAPRDVEELLPQLEPRAEELAALATRRLRERGSTNTQDPFGSEAEPSPG